MIMFHLIDGQNGLPEVEIVQLAQNICFDAKRPTRIAWMPCDELALASTGIHTSPWKWRRPIKVHGGIGVRNGACWWTMSWCQSWRLSQNEIYILYGAACQWEIPVTVHPGVVMCSHYVQSFHFSNRDSAALARFAEEFISTCPPPPEIHDYQFENQWWTSLAQATVPSPTVCLFQ